MYPFCSISGTNRYFSLGEVWCTALRPHKAVLFACPGLLSSHLLSISSSGGYCIIARVCVRPVSCSTLLTLHFPDRQQCFLSHGSSLFPPSNSYPYCLDLVSMFQFKWTRTPRSADPH